MIDIRQLILPGRTVRAIYCVSPARTRWDADHLNATIVAGSPLETPVILADAVQIRQIPAWLAPVAPHPAFTVPGTIWLHPNTVYLPAELLVHEQVHYLRAQAGALKYWWSVIAGVCIGTARAITRGGGIHQWSPIEVEARAIAADICNPTPVPLVVTDPIDAPAEIARRLT